MSPTAKPYEIRLLGGTAIVEGDVDGDGQHGLVFEVKSGTELRRLSTDQRNAMLEALARIGGSLVSFAEDDPLPIETRLLLSAGAASAGTPKSTIAAALKLGQTKYRKLEHLAPLEDAAGRMMRLMVTETGGERPTLRQLEERAQVAVDVCQVVFSGSGGQLDALIDALKPVTPPMDPDEIDLHEAEARARLRLKAMYRKVLEESLTVAQLKDDFGLSRQRLKQLRDEDRLFAIDIPYQKGLVYPAWQLDSSGRPRAAMQPIIRSAKEANLEALSLHLLMTGRREGGRTGVELLNANREDLVLAMVRGADR